MKRIPIQSRYQNIMKYGSPSEINARQIILDFATIDTNYLNQIDSETYHKLLKSLNLNDAVPLAYYDIAKSIHELYESNDLSETHNMQASLILLIQLLEAERN